MTKIPAVLAPAPREKKWNRHLAPSAAFSWLAAGWCDLITQPLASLGYGALVFLVSVAHRCRSVLVRLGLHSIPRFRRVHGGGPDPRHWSV